MPITAAVDSYSELIRRGKNYNEIAKIRGIKYGSALHYIHAYPDLLGEYERMQTLKKSAEEGRLTLDKIGKTFGGFCDESVSRERARQILEELGWSDARRDARKRYKEAQRKSRTYELKALVVRAGKAYSDFLKIAKEKPFPKAYKKAMEYYLGRKRFINYGFDSILKLFKVYYEAKAEEKKLSLKDLGEVSGIHPTQAGKILKTGGEEPLYGALEIKRLTEEQKRIARKAIRSKTKLSYSVRGKIIGIPYYVLEQMATKKGISRRGQKIYFAYDGPEKVGIGRSLDVFKTLDDGIQDEEVMKRVNIKTKKAFEAVLSHRKEIEKEVDKFKGEVGLNN